MRRGLKRSAACVDLIGAKKLARIAAAVLVFVVLQGHLRRTRAIERHLAQHLKA